MQFSFLGIYKHFLWSFRGVILGELWHKLFRMVTTKIFPTPATGQYVCKQHTRWKREEKICCKRRWFFFHSPCLLWWKVNKSSWVANPSFAFVTFLFKKVSLSPEKVCAHFCQKLLYGSTQIPESTLNTCSLEHVPSSSHPTSFHLRASGLSSGDKRSGYKSIFCCLSQTHRTQVYRDKFQKSCLVCKKSNNEGRSCQHSLYGRIHKIAVKALG